MIMKIQRHLMYANYVCAAIILLNKTLQNERPCAISKLRSIWLAAWENVIDLHSSMYAPAPMAQVTHTHTHIQPMNHLGFFYR